MVRNQVNGWKNEWLIDDFNLWIYEWLIDESKYYEWMTDGWIKNLWIDEWLKNELKNWWKNEKYTKNE